MHWDQQLGELDKIIKWPKHISKIYFVLILCFIQ